MNRGPKATVILVYLRSTLLSRGKDVKLPPPLAEAVPAAPKVWRSRGEGCAQPRAVAGKQALP